MTVLEDEVLPIRNKLSLSKRYVTKSLKRKTNNTSEESNPAVKKLFVGDMLNGYRTADHHHHHSGGGGGGGGRNADVISEYPVATLSNMGNTCYLNSVLYSLRFAPTFLHNLHHLVEGLDRVGNRVSQSKAKSSSLGRNMGGLTGQSSRSTSSKDLLALSSYTDAIPKSKVQLVTEKLHELFMTMRNMEDRKKDCNDAYQPTEFLQAVREANYIFDGNQQQDAHELLVYLLDNIRETCKLLQHQTLYYPDFDTELSSTNHGDNTVGGGNTSNNTTNNSTAGSGGGGSITWLNRLNRQLNTVVGKKQKDKKQQPRGGGGGGGSKDATISEEEMMVGGGVSGGGREREERGESSASGNIGMDVLGDYDQQEKEIFNPLKKDFEGVTLRRTKCLECESVTERKELFYDIPVPINFSEDEVNTAERHMINPSEVYRRACVTSEKLCDANKYLCDHCQRYNEASREVSFEKLPNILVLQLKRFTTSSQSYGVVGSGVTSGGHGGGGGVGNSHHPPGIQKITSYMPTPLTLACFCEKCCRYQAECEMLLEEEMAAAAAATAGGSSSSKPSKLLDKTAGGFIGSGFNTLHEYQLCCVIMHLGGTLASGHYISYVRAGGGGSVVDMECVKEGAGGGSASGEGGGRGGSGSATSGNIFKLFQKSSKSSSTLPNPDNPTTNNTNHLTLNGGPNATSTTPLLPLSTTTNTKSSSSRRNHHNHNHNNHTTCRSHNCCGVKMNYTALENAVNSYSSRGNTRGSSAAAATGTTATATSNGLLEESGGAGGSSNKVETDDVWLECDDENVRPITRVELERLLGGKVNPMSTPYLLFYTKSPSSLATE